MKKYKIYFITLVFLLLPQLCFADGGMPILLIVNIYAFFAGSLWVFLSEFLYLNKLFKKRVPRKRIAKWVLLINLVSAIIGGIIIPIVFLFTGLERFMYYQENQPFLLIACFIIDFLVTYVITVIIEYKLFYRFIAPDALLTKKETLRHTCIFNLISYVGLVLIVLLTILKLNNKLSGG